MILWVSISAGFRAYTLVDPDTDEVTVIPNTSEHRGGVRVSPEFLSKTGTHVMLCSGIGPKAVHLFEQFDIDVFVGADTVRDVIEAWQQRRLMEATDENACKRSTGIVETRFGMS